MTHARFRGTTIPLPEPPAGWFDYRYALLMDGTLAVSRTDRDIHAEFAAWRSQALTDRAFPPARARLSTFDGISERPAFDVPLCLVDAVDRLADGRWVLVSARAAPGEANARLYAPDGTPSGSFAVGDGVSHLRCAPDGTIWVGYFDEGIFCGLNEDGSWPISSSGIARFAPDGTFLWRFNTEERTDLSIADCYALALDGNAIWSCSYTDFAVVRVDGGQVHHWPNTISGAKAMAIEADHVVLAGGYKNEAGRIALLHLEAARARHLGDIQLEPLRGVPRLVQGQRATLHFVGEGCWRRLTVSMAHAALGAK